jgi:predicted outer membrane lipoprotein
MHFTVKCAVAGLILICAFALLRAASFHHVNAMLGSGAHPPNWGWAQELTGIFLVGCAAVFYKRRMSKEM